MFHISKFQLTSLTLTGEGQALGDSNIVPNSLAYDFLAFKCLTTLILIDIEIHPDKIGTFGMLRNTLVNLEATRCGLKSLSDILLGDVPQASISKGNNTSDDTINTPEDDKISKNSNHLWKMLQYLNLRDNNINVIDGSINLAPQIRTLLLCANSIKVIENLEGLPNLSILEITDNRLENLDALHTKLGQITRLNFANNKIRSLAGCSKLYCLVHLNVASNKINDLDNVLPVSKLPCLESLNLQGNHVTTVVDYRLKVFEAFGKKCSDLCLGKYVMLTCLSDKTSDWIGRALIKPSSILSDSLLLTFIFSL